MCPDQVSEVSVKRQGLGNYGGPSLFEGRNTAFDNNRDDYLRLKSETQNAIRCAKNIFEKKNNRI